MVGRNYHARPSRTHFCTPLFPSPRESLEEICWQIARMRKKKKYAERNGAGDVWRARRGCRRKINCVRFEEPHARGKLARCHPEKDRVNRWNAMRVSSRKIVKNGSCRGEMAEEEPRRFSSRSLPQFRDYEINIAEYIPVSRCWTDYFSQRADRKVLARHGSSKHCPAADDWRFGVGLFEGVRVLRYRLFPITRNARNRRQRLTFALWNSAARLAEVELCQGDFAHARKVRRARSLALSPGHFRAAPRPSLRDSEVERCTLSRGSHLSKRR